MDLEEFEDKIDQLISEAHKEGISYWQILRVFLNLCQRLQMQADAEYYARAQKG